MNMKINQLKPHPQHSKIYYTPKDIRVEWADLFASMEDIGMKDAIHITTKNVIISGHRRWMVAKELGWSDVRVEIIDEEKENINSLIVQLNTNREKTQAEKINEVLFLLKTIKKRQGKNNLPDDEKGGRYEVIARKMGKGFCRENIAKIEKIQLNDIKSNQSFIDLLRQGASIDSVLKEIDNNKNLDTNNIEKIIQDEKGNYTLINGDAKVELDKVGFEQIDMCISSIPYWKQRTYDKNYDNSEKVEGWGEEKKIEDYYNTSEQVFSKIYSTLNETGSFYLNISDTIKNGECLCIPDELCRIAKKIGFKLVNRIIWHVTNRKPQNLKKQLNTSYETIFHFVKDIEKYKHRQLRYKTKEKSVVSKSVGDRIKGNKKKTNKRIIISPYSKFRDFIENNSKCIDVIRTSVATTQELKKETGDDFPAVAPENLGVLFLLQSTNVGDKVMDVCSGSSTFGFCTMFGRKYVGVEISKEYHKIGKDRLDYFTKQIDEKEIKEFESLAMAA